jgi:hypothetical protein
MFLVRNFSFLALTYLGALTFYECQMYIFELSIKTDFFIIS